MAITMVKVLDAVDSVQSLVSQNEDKLVRMQEGINEVRATLAALATVNAAAFDALDTAAASLPNDAGIQTAKSTKDRIVAEGIIVHGKAVAWLAAIGS